MDALDRRSLLLRGVGGAAALALPGLRFVPVGRGAPDRRLTALARLVDGPVIGPASARYHQARLGYNERFDGVHPLGIVQPASVADVRQVVGWSRKTGIRVAVRSGGHSYAGYSTTNGLVVDLRRLSSIRIDTSTGIATIGAGARLIDIEAALARRGRAIPSGSCATVGIGGLALGGGVGLASRKFGTTSDNIVGLGIVTADGRYRTCSATENADLFWACRGGGGGNFGVVTHFAFRTHPVSTVSYFFAGWPWSQAAEVIENGKRSRRTLRTSCSRSARSGRAQRSRPSSASASSSAGRPSSGRCSRRSPASRASGSRSARPPTSTPSCAGQAASARRSLNAISPARRHRGRSSERASQRSPTT